MIVELKITGELEGNPTLAEVFRLLGTEAPKEAPEDEPERKPAKAKAAKSKPAPKPDPSEPEEEADQDSGQDAAQAEPVCAVTFEELREAGMRAINSGKRGEFIAVLDSHGVERITDLADADKPAALAEIEALCGKEA